MKVTALPPGPRGGLLLGSLRPFVRDPLGFMTQCAREHGDILLARFLSRRVIVLNRPDLIEAVLVTHNSNFIKPPNLRTPGVRRIMGNGLVTSDGEFWRRQRRLAQPAFHRERIAGYGAVAVHFTERMLAGWKAKATVDLHQEMMQLTLHIVSKTLFDADVAGQVTEIGESLDTCIRLFAMQWTLRGVLMQRFPTPEWAKLRRAAERLDKVIYRLIQEHRESRKDRGDLLSMLLAAQDDDGSRMTDQQLRDEAMTLFLAGHETTATALCWTWLLLMDSPGVMASLQAELDEVLGGRAPGFGDIPRLRYTEQIIKESMRLYPPVWAVGRQALKDMELGGYRIPAGSNVVVSQWVLHRDARYFEEPEKFRPERWTEDFARQLPKFAYFPFSGGPRNCIGSSFAMMEAVLILATMASRFQLQRESREPIRPFASITLRPTGNLNVMVTERQPVRGSTAAASAKVG